MRTLSGQLLESEGGKGDGSSSSLCRFSQRKGSGLDEQSMDARLSRMQRGGASPAFCRKSSRGAPALSAHSRQSSFGKEGRAREQSMDARLSRMQRCCGMGGGSPLTPVRHSSRLSRSLDPNRMEREDEART